MQFVCGKNKNDVTVSISSEVDGLVSLNFSCPVNGF